jgi:hypothetical protein
MRPINYDKWGHCPTCGSYPGEPCWQKMADHTFRYKKKPHVARGRYRKRKKEIVYGRKLKKRVDRG